MKGSSLNATERVSASETDDLYASVAGQYALYRPEYPVALFNYLASLTDKHNLALDGACGNGQASYRLAERYSEVVAVDSSPKQIEQAKRHHPHPQITYKNASAETVGREVGIFPNSLDLITVATALHWLKEKEFFAEAHKLLKPRGVLAHWTYTSSRLTIDDPAFKEVIDEFVERITPSWPVNHFGSAHKSGKPPVPYDALFKEIKTPPITMTVSRNLDQFLGYVRTWSAIPRYIEEYGVDPVEDFERKITPIWGDPSVCRSASQILFLKVFRKRETLASLVNNRDACVGLKFCLGS